MRPQLWVFIAVVGLTAWLFGPALLGTHTFVFRDGAHYFPPLFGFNVEEWRAGRVPLWNPYEQIGMPALAENTASVFYPGQLILLLPIPFLWAYNLYVVAHVVLAAYGALRLARYGGVSTLAAGQAGLAYAFSGSVLFQYCNVIFLVGAAWLPFALLALDRLLRTEDRGKAGAGKHALQNAAWMGLFLALMVLGGDPQMGYHVALLGAAYAGYLSWTERGRCKEPRSATAAPADPTAAAAGSAMTPVAGSESSFFRNILRRFALLAGAGSVGVALAAVQILPTWELAAMGPRARHDLPRSLWELATSPTEPGLPPAKHATSTRFAALVDASAGGEHLQKSYQFSVGPWRWLELLWPNVGGRQFPIHRRWMSALPSDGRIWTPSLYCGAITMVLAFGGWRLRRSDPRLRCCWWMTLAAVVAGLGEYGLGWLAFKIGDWAHVGHEGIGVGGEFGGLYWLMNLVVPGYVAFRYPAKLWTIAALGISLLAARGWDAAWADARGAKAAAVRLGCLGAISVGIAAIVLFLRRWLAGLLATAPPDSIFGPLDATGALDDVVAGLIQSGIVCAVAACLLLVMRRRWPVFASIALLLLSVGDLAVAHRWLVPCIDVADWQTRPVPAETVLAGVVGLGDPPPRIYRDSHWLPDAWNDKGSPDRLMEMFRWDRETLWPKYHLPLHIGSVESSGMLVPDDYMALWEVAREHGKWRWMRVDDSRLPNSSVFDLLGAGHLVMSERAPAIDKEIDQVFAYQPPFLSLDSMSILQKNLEVRPRAWIVHRVALLRPLDDNRLNRVRARTEDACFPVGKSRDWQSEAIVESAAPLRYPPVLLSAAQSGIVKTESCRIESYQPQRVVLEAEMASPGLVVLADMFYPGWELTVDDGSGPRPVEILRTNRVMRGVSLPAGKFRLEFNYRPTGFRYGATISGIAWLTLMLAAAFAYWPQRTLKSPN